MTAEMEKLPLTLRYDCPDCLTWWEAYYDTERDDDCPECGSLCAPTEVIDPAALEAMERRKG